jgi:hypothetical protein
MMIVSVTRGDLRDEFDMADEAFALSPINARASLPSEEDYDAISQAFMETSRGRWFLGEYAKRNRNADTRMVLDAVERIEQTIAAQKQPAPESGLTEALAAIRHAVGEARAAATAAVEDLARQENLAPVRKGARIIKEISWRWREIGADARICDLLDSQVGAIEGACEQISPASTLTAVGAAFDLLKARIGGFDDGDAAAPQAAEAAVPSPSSAAAHDEAPAAMAEIARAASATDDAEAAISLPAEAVVESVEVTAEVVAATAEVAAETDGMAADAAEVTSEAVGDSAEAAEAYDEALLDMVALEMGAPDDTELEDAELEDAADAVADEADAAAESPPAEPVAEMPEPVLVSEAAAPTAPAPAPAAVQPSLQPALEPLVEPSLGSTLLANGIIRKPSPVSDPLAPIRRMSQAEKIAFFS